MINHNFCANVAGLAFLEMGGIQVDIEIGVLPSEQGRKQRIQIDAVIGFDERMVDIGDTEADLLKNGFDSRVAREAILTAVTSSRFNLLESLASKISDNILKLRGAQCLDLKISKHYLWADTSSTSLRIFRKK